MELHGRHLDGPDDASEFGDAQFVRVPVVAGEGDPHRLDPVRRAARNALLVDLVAVDSARKAVQHARALAQRPDDPVPDAHVVPREVELRLAPRREIHAIGTRDANGSALDFELDGIGLLRHDHVSMESRGDVRRATAARGGALTYPSPMAGGVLVAMLFVVILFSGAKVLPITLLVWIVAAVAWAVAARRLRNRRQPESSGERLRRAGRHRAVLAVPLIRSGQRSASSRGSAADRLGKVEVVVRVDA